MEDEKEKFAGVYMSSWVKHANIHKEYIKLFKPGDRVRMKYFDGYATGEVTIVSEMGVKVMFDGEFDLDYYYYDPADLEVIEK